MAAPPVTVPSNVADPYYQWALDSDFAACGATPPATQPAIGPASLFAVLAECAATHDPGKLDAALKTWPGNANSGRAYVVPIYLPANATIGASSLTTRFCTLHVERQLLPKLLHMAEIRRWEFGAPVDATPPTPSTVATHAPGSQLTGVVAAVIDDQVAAFHHEFLDNSGQSRVAYLWDQDQNPQLAGSGASASPPRAFTYGHEFRPSVGVSTPNPPNGGLKSARRAAHGTAVAGLFVGKTSPWHKLVRFDAALADRTRAAPTDNASNAPIVAVHLPRNTVKDTSGSALPTSVLDALRYSIDKCDDSAKIVVNISYGGIAGPHDGSSLLEQAMQELAQLMEGRLIVVAPAGNSREAMCHARLSATHGKPDSVLWKLPPDGDSPSYMEMWFPDVDVGGVTVSLAKVGNAALAASVKPGSGTQLLHNAAGAVIGSLTFAPLSPLGNNRAMVLLTLAPTVAGAGTLGAAPHGLWQVTLANSKKAAIEADVWIERNDSAPGQRTRRRQSHLSADPYTRPGAKPGLAVDAPQQKIRRSGTTSNLASGTFVEAVGGYRLSDRRLAVYSSGGETGRIEGPVCASPSEQGFGMLGLRVIGSNTGDSIRMQGTSLAAPIWARYLVHELMAGHAAPTKKAILAGTAPPPMAPPPTAPKLDPDTGFGCFSLI